MNETLRGQRGERSAAAPPRPLLNPASVWMREAQAEARPRGALGSPGQSLPRSSGPGPCGSEGRLDGGAAPGPQACSPRQRLPCALGLLPCYLGRAELPLRHLPGPHSLLSLPLSPLPGDSAGAGLAGAPRGGLPKASACVFGRPCMARRRSSDPPVKRSKCPGPCKVDGTQAARLNRNFR